MTCESILKKYFGYDEFREGQRVLIDSILEGRDTLGIMPTGAESPCAIRFRRLSLGGSPWWSPRSSP